MEVFVRIIRTLVEHSTLNGTDKQELLGLIDAIENPPAPEAPAASADGTAGA